MYAIVPQWLWGCRTVTTFWLVSWKVLSLKCNRDRHSTIAGSEWKSVKCAPVVEDKNPLKCSVSALLQSKWILSYRRVPPPGWNLHHMVAFEYGTSSSSVLEHFWAAVSSNQLILKTGVHFPIVSFLPINAVIMLCCCFRFRIPRTKQDIEADFRRKKITRKFRERLACIQNSDMDEMDLKKGKILFLFIPHCDSVYSSPSSSGTYAGGLWQGERKKITWRSRFNM